MKKQFLFFIMAAALLTFLPGCKKETKYTTLIITGQNNHKWKESSVVLKQILDETGLFSSEIMITPEKGGNMNKFNPDFSKYKLVVLDYNGDSWSDNTNTAFLKYVKDGGGVVIYHAADNSFPEWKEYNEIIGLGGWGNRTEKMVHMYIIKIISLLLTPQQVMAVLMAKGESFWSEQGFQIIL